METCYHCNGKAFVTRPVEITTKIGEVTVVDTSFKRPVCKRCGEFVIPARTLRKIEIRAAVLAFERSPRSSGKMVRFARHALGLRQPEFAERLGTTIESVSRWEREERPMERWVPLCVLGLLRAKLMPSMRAIEML